jgi:hypothetical protein
MTEPDIFTMDIELAPVTTLASSPASSILEQESPKKRKATPAPVLVPAKRQKRASVVVVSELAEIPVIQSRAGRVVRRTDKAKAFY